MSAINGDKARFNRERKRGIARRKRYRDLTGRPAEPVAASASKPKVASA